MKYLTPLKIKIKKLDINESYFLGKVEFEENEYKINIQGEWKGKLLKLPFKLGNEKKVLVRLTGSNDIVVEDYLMYRGISEWMEIDSQFILHFLADHQDKLDSLEIYLEENLDSTN
jgi:hypothetical protein